MERTGRPLLQRIEPWLFLAVVLVHLWPLFSSPWVVTLDGPSHLNNARIMSDLLLGRGTMHEFFTLNPYPEPNMLGHAVMALVMMVVPAWVAEKVVLVLAVAGLAYAFRILVRIIAPENPCAAFLVMPFLMGFPFFMGFINFCLSLPLLLLVIAAWERRLKSEEARKPWGMLALFALLYLSHLSSCLLALGMIGARSGWAWLMNENGVRASIKHLAIHLLTVTAAPLVLITGFFVLHHDHAAVPARYAFSELLKWVLEGRAWVTFASEPEVPWTKPIAIALLLLALVGVAAHIRQRERGSRAPIFWLCPAAGLFVFYFSLPDTMAGGSFASVRLLLFAMLLLCCWIAVSRVPRWLLCSAAATVVIADLGHLNVQTGIERSLQNETGDLLEVSIGLGQGDVLLPLNYSGNWMHSNFSSYLGATTGAVVLDNFVATAPFAPVQWRPERLPYHAIGNFDSSDRPCVDIDAYRAGDHPLVSHVLTFHLFDDVTDSCTDDLRRQLDRGFRLVTVSTSGDARLYERN